MNNRLTENVRSGVAPIFSRKKQRHALFAHPNNPNNSGFDGGPPNQTRTPQQDRSCPIQMPPQNNFTRFEGGGDVMQQQQSHHSTQPQGMANQRFGPMSQMGSNASAAQQKGYGNFSRGNNNFNFNTNPDEHFSNNLGNAASQYGGQGSCMQGGGNAPPQYGGQGSCMQGGSSGPAGVARPHASFGTGRPNNSGPSNMGLQNNGPPSGSYGSSDWDNSANAQTSGSMYNQPGPQTSWNNMPPQRMGWNDFQTQTGPSTTSPPYGHAPYEAGPSGLSYGSGTGQQSWGQANVPGVPVQNTWNNGNSTGNNYAMQNHMPGPGGDIGQQGMPSTQAGSKASASNSFRIKTSSSSSAKRQQPSLHFVPATVEGMLHWSQFRNKVPMTFELIAMMNSAISPSDSSTAKEFVIRDQKTINAIFYEIDRQLPRLVRGQWYRCVGNLENRSGKFRLVSIRTATDAEKSNHAALVNSADKKMRMVAAKSSEM